MAGTDACDGQLGGIPARMGWATLITVAWSGIVIIVLDLLVIVFFGYGVCQAER